MRLKHLSLLGYKTFADRAEFLFDEGITAVVGPNGSGKSNVADAVRWALGEQSLSLLRAKKSEDMIFLGSERRARLGMAEVTLTLDNSTHWLPVEFEEVAITRRAYRSGENVYMLNGSRVRLRDIADLLGKSGLSKRTYTVVGQGLIDTALSLRPQERRRLIEEAAGLTLYHSRRTETLDKLEETKRNVLRVQDLVIEIEPRLRRLSRQAERAREHAQIQAELDQALRVWYSYQWKHGQDELGRQRTILAYQEGQLEQRRERVRATVAQIAQLRARQSELREQLSTWHRESSALHAQSEAYQRELAVFEERRRGLMQRREELQSEIVPLDASRAANSERIAAAERALSALQETLHEQRSAVNEAQSAHSAWRAALSSLQEARDQTRERLLDLRAQIADRKSRLAQLEERRDDQLEAQAAYEASSRVLTDKVNKLQGELGAVVTRLETIAAAASRVDAQRAQHEHEAAVLGERRRALEAQRNDLDQQMGRLRERHEVLARMSDEGAGLYEGVRNVVHADPGQLDGVVGTVAQLVEVPRDLEVAIEVALGSQLQDVVVETWENAQEAIAYLKRTQGGRATFLPLDTLRPGRPVRAPQMAGVVGIASELVDCAPHLRPVVAYLLGRTLVCQDLAVARRLLDEVTGSYQIVTPEGDQVRSSGAVTGGRRRQGRRGQGSGILSRERELRELPAQLQALADRIETLDTERADVSNQEKALEDALAVLAVQQNKLTAERQEQERAHAEAQGQIARARDERQWHRSLIDKAGQDLAELEERERALQQGIADLETQVLSTATALSEQEAQIEQMDDRDLNERLVDLREQVALTRQEQASREAELGGFRYNQQGIERQIAHRRQRIQESTTQLERIEEQIADLRDREGALAGEIQSFAALIEPAEQSLRDLEGRQEELEATEKQARTRVQVYEARFSQMQLQVARQEEQMEHLRSQIEDDLGLVDLEMGEDLSGQPLLPIHPLVSSLPEVEVLPTGLEEQIRALKRRLNRLGAVNPDAPDEYQELLARYEFLVTQSQDLEEAAARLREVIAELDEVMRREFKRTFDGVAREFRAYFRRLFNGGSARLQLTEPDNLMTTGIDIIARPPGKRQQGLAVLSGGERALTGAALIFAILAVSPTPFCVLDEVDAALDEANVGRFRSVLKELSQETQFVVITHNRYTIDAADIVYGISMGGDGASCVISHRLQKET